VNTEKGLGSPRIVAGVDGSPSSKAALRWAIRQAGLTGAVVEAVTAWWYPTGYGMAPIFDGAVDFEGDAGKTLAEALAEVSGLAPDVMVCPRVIEGHPAGVLLREARGADLLVVGSRGHGGFAAALLGSVSQHCVQHAPCPVLVLRGDDAG
jgi:nucleotide-binding universal stress UspA family protein